MSNEQTQTTGTSQLQRLQALQAKNKEQAQKSAMTVFNGLVGVYVGTPAKEHYPKLKDENGNNVKDENGRDKRSDKKWKHVFYRERNAYRKLLILSSDINVTFVLIGEHLALKC